MEKIVNALGELHKINSAYDLSNDSVEKILEEIPSAKVCTPIIGKFSSGKSALVNTLLGDAEGILSEDITPETAVPAEIVYTDLEDSVILYKTDGTQQEMSIDEYCESELNANEVIRSRINLRALESFLEEIPDVMLVDMPGFESGLEIHNKAIDNYLPQSLAYIVTFPADDMIVRSSIGNILRELCLNDMPVCIVITKYDKRNDEFDATFEKLKENLRRFIGEKPVRYCITSSREGDVEDVEDYLREIQQNSQDILANKYKGRVLSALDNTEGYLKTLLNNSGMTESELDEEEERLAEQLKDLDEKLGGEKSDFDAQIPGCVAEIKADVEKALHAEKDTLVNMALNGQNINDHLNAVVRNAVTVSVKKRLIPLIKKYLKRVDACINGAMIGDIHVNLDMISENVGKGAGAAVVATIAAGFLLGPLAALISGVIALVSNWFGKKKRREEIKEQIRAKLCNEVFPQIMTQVGHGLDMEITKQVKIVNSSVEKELHTQKETLEKAMSDLREKINDERAQKENLEIDIKEDLERIEGLKNDLQ